MQRREPRGRGGRPGGGGGGGPPAGAWGGRAAAAEDGAARRWGGGGGPNGRGHEIETVRGQPSSGHNNAASSQWGSCPCPTESWEDVDTAGWGECPAVPSAPTPQPPQPPAEDPVDEGSGWGDSPTDVAATPPTPGPGGAAGWGSVTSGWGSEDTGESCGGWGNSTDAGGWHATDGPAPQPAPPAIVWDAPWIPNRRAEGIQFIDWGLLAKNPLERLAERKVELRQETNVGYEMLIRMGWKDEMAGLPARAPPVVWKEGRKGLSAGRATPAPPAAPPPPPPCPAPHGPLATHLHRANPQAYQALWGTYCANWRKTGEYS